MSTAVPRPGDSDGVDLANCTENLPTDLLTVRDGKIVEVHLFTEDGPTEDAFWGAGLISRKRRTVDYLRASRTTVGH